MMRRAIALAVVALGWSVSAAPTGAALKKRLPEGVIAIPLIRIENQTAYGMDFDVGTPPQKNTLKIDTGSATIGFESPNSNECQQSNQPCAEYGSYNNMTSSTAVFSSNGYYNMLSDMGLGVYVNDTLTFGGQTVDSFTFGVLDNVYASWYIQAPDAGIMGLSQLCANTSCNGYPTLVQQLYDRNIITTRAFSVYLGPDYPDTVGTLLLGGIDQAKQRGPVTTLPMNTSPTDGATGFQPYNLDYTGMAFTTANGTRTTVPIDAGSYSGLDTGSPDWNIPQAAFNLLAPALGLTPANITARSPIPVDCAYKKAANANATLEVQFTQGAVVSIPAYRLVTDLGDGTCGTYVGWNSGNGGPGGASSAFGDPFLRNVYVTFDLDELTISLSEVSFTDDEDIVAI